ncbi:hypothetical protein G7Y41_05695 [Schaalia sp. ZJ405]|uniref:hypothetical protein n=1 Tax=Schaalia sp. ZJ405 TaxID=2709403 RepID=UPI0013EAC1A2|nr:hypothetical protein [Schaalia sp. ZJ405]QPK80594.1 hypothetical protein G7Y41_05695 [Schaalia sp. ZJ405]
MDILNTYYDHSATADGIFGLLLFFGSFLMVAVIAVPVIYIIRSIFQMRLLQAVGHQNPVSAWIPLWRDITLLEAGGIRQPVIWVLILWCGTVVLGWIPVIGQLLVFAIGVAGLMLGFWRARAIQEGFGINSTGGAIFGAILPFFWVIWISSVAQRAQFNRDHAIQVGGTFPLNFFGEGNPYAPFGFTSSPNYAQPQADYGYQDQAQQGYGNPGAPQPGYGTPYTQPDAPQQPGYSSPMSAQPPYGTPAAPQQPYAQPDPNAPQVPQQPLSYPQSPEPPQTDDPSTQQ